MKKISFIIPVYNAEKYINRCLENMLKYKGEDVEFIIINDGSTDSSDDILKKYEKKDKRIVYINKNNTGVSNSRNIGMKKATGEYIAFIDIDDYLEENSIDGLINVLKSSDADLYIMPYYLNKDENKKNVEYSFLKTKIYNTREQIYGIIPNIIGCVDEQGNRITNIMGSVWSKIFKSNIIKKYNITMNESIEITEDMIFLIEYIMHCNEIKIIDYYFYNYTIENNQSLGRKYKINLYNELQISLNNIEKILEKRNIVFRNVIEYRRFFDIYVSIINECKNSTTIRNKQKNIQNIIKNLKDDDLKILGLSKKEKIIKFFIKKNWLMPLLIIYYSIKV